MSKEMNDKINKWLKQTSHMNTIRIKGIDNKIIFYARNDKSNIDNCLVIENKESKSTEYSDYSDITLNFNLFKKAFNTYYRDFSDFDLSFSHKEYKKIDNHLETIIIKANVIVLKHSQSIIRLRDICEHIKIKCLPITKDQIVISDEVFFEKDKIQSSTIINKYKKKNITIIELASKHHQQIKIEKINVNLNDSKTFIDSDSFEFIKYFGFTRNDIDYICQSNDYKKQALLFQLLVSKHFLDINKNDLTITPKQIYNVYLSNTDIMSSNIPMYIKPYNKADKKQWINAITKYRKINDNDNELIKLMEIDQTNDQTNETIDQTNDQTNETIDQTNETIDQTNDQTNDQAVNPLFVRCRPPPPLNSRPSKLYHHHQPGNSSANPLFL